MNAIVSLSIEVVCKLDSYWFYLFQGNGRQNVLAAVAEHFMGG